ncbi:MAG: hypothetical protein JWN14_1863 [Chthonomonadales bacterium]|nr:hypothetical protein [Chthonomonadales bacterium]
MTETPPTPIPEEPPFHRAARLGDIATLERLIESVDINARMDLYVGHGGYLSGVTPLMIAARSLDGANVHTLAWLLEHGADLYAKSDGDTTAAWYCAGAGGRWELPFPLVSDQVERLRFLLDAGLDPQETSSNGRSLLVEACSIGDPARVKLLLDRQVPPTPSVTPAEDIERYASVEAAGLTNAALELHKAALSGTWYSFQIPLFCAAESGSAECVQLLLDAGAEVEIMDSMGLTALAHAGSPEVLHTLISAGADLHAKLGRSGEEDVLGQILEGAGTSAHLHGPGRFAVAQALLDAGAPLDHTDFSDWTRLYFAAFRHQADAVDFLLAQGASCRSTESGTPLHGICWQGEYTDPEVNIACERIIRALVAAGIPLDSRDPQGNTPLHKAVHGDWSNLTAVRLLLEFGAQPDLINNEGHTPLHLAAGWGALSCVQALLAAGADPHRPDADGDTAVDLARQYQDTWTQIAAEAKPLNNTDDPTKQRNPHQQTLQDAADSLATLIAATTAPPVPDPTRPHSSQ